MLKSLAVGIAFLLVYIVADVATGAISDQRGEDGDADQRAPASRLRPRAERLLRAAVGTMLVGEWLGATWLWYIASGVTLVEARMPAGGEA
ncbi:MAG: hypothetical protein GTO22_01560 [Gemmatimonadales bacterium]|nr:hypothetical protein [Gemmatimonadales bacterium]